MLNCEFNEDGTQSVSFCGVPVPSGVLSMEPRAASPQSRNVSEVAYRTVTLAFNWASELRKESIK